MSDVPSDFERSMGSGVSTQVSFRTLSHLQRTIRIVLNFIQNALTDTLSQPSAVADVLTEKQADTKKHTQRIPPSFHGEWIVVNADKVDRSRANHHEKDDTKLTISWTEQRKNSENDEQNTESKLIEYKYGHEVDWTNQSSVKKLNNWRDQVCIFQILFIRPCSYLPSRAS